MDLHQVCSNYTPGDKNGPPGGHMFYIGLYKGKHDIFFLSETTRTKALIFGTTTKFVQIMPLGAKMGQPEGSHCFT